MNAGKKELLCSKCRKRVSYHVYTRPAKAIIKDLEINYEEYYGICDECKEEIYIPGFEDRNVEMIETAYREEKGLITIPEIKEILEKYNIEKRPLSKLLGFGELTITRYLDGQLPSKKYSNILFEVLYDEQYLKGCVDKNKDVIAEATISKVNQAIRKCEIEKTYNNSAEKIALYIIHSKREITNLLLQKILYYVKAISILFEGNTIIPEPCESWKYGPVFPSVYEKYKDFGKQEIVLHLSDEYVNGLLSEKEKQITEFVLKTFGIYNVWFLKDITHCEEPWIEARNGIDDNDVSHNRIDDDLIIDYFHRMNELYNLTTEEGVDSYVKDMRNKIYD